MGNNCASVLPPFIYIVSFLFRRRGREGRERPRLPEGSSICWFTAAMPKARVEPGQSQGPKTQARLPWHGQVPKYLREFALAEQEQGFRLDPLKTQTPPRRITALPNAHLFHSSVLFLTFSRY